MDSRDFDSHGEALVASMDETRARVAEATAPDEQIKGSDYRDRPPFEDDSQATDASPDGQAQSDPDAGPAENNPSWAMKAVKAERQKRQALAARVAELEPMARRLAELESAQAPQQAELDPNETKFWNDPYKAIAQERVNQNARLSRAEYIAENGKERFVSLMSAVANAMQSGHPDLPLVEERAQQSDNPVAVVEDWASQVLGWGSEDLSQQPARPSRAFPNDFGNLRTVAPRNGGGWSGRPSIGDILASDRKTAKSIFKMG